MLSPLISGNDLCGHPPKAVLLPNRPTVSFPCSAPFCVEAQLVKRLAPQGCGWSARLLVCVCGPVVGQRVASGSTSGSGDIDGDGWVDIRVPQVCPASSARSSQSDRTHSCVRKRTRSSLQSEPMPLRCSVVAVTDSKAVPCCRAMTTTTSPPPALWPSGSKTS